MTLTPFRGRCHTCGHDHDAEGQTLHDILTTVEPSARIEADRAAMQMALEALTLAGEKMPLDEPWTDRDAIIKARIAAIAALRERLK
jgi:hypothetical protein